MIRNAWHFYYALAHVFKVHAEASRCVAHTLAKR
ncbi:DUF3265 domain-containing protein [Vibrio parahaemolyticus]|nr:DUF3265 domain-containing protein [Vibrio parahaemolyticus]TOE47148.1 DUF3265 domain-containing protein [Vibrio parahaemolyticus]TOF17906.1 DUF3265 domain-containing protein [Vibrio parahaemolyticus]TOG17231.1 DUF3265 domain-containing protein [Vibrio parahaemolyticus]TOH24974.1 DUF3265 domain-containing protein [Vibrio parahaemolyticus]